MRKNKRPSTEDTVTELLDGIFGPNDSHREVAIELVPKYNDARSSLTSVLRYLVHYKESDLL